MSESVAIDESTHYRESYYCLYARSLAGNHVTELRQTFVKKPLKSDE